MVMKVICYNDSDAEYGYCSRMNIVVRYIVGERITITIRKMVDNGDGKS